jgi:hypothetical protein
MKNRSQTSKQAGKIKTATLIISLIVGLAFSIAMGVTAGAMGLGSIYPQLNLIAKPLVCPGTEMSYSRRVSEIGTATYYTAEWFCVDQTGARTELEPNVVFLYAGIFYGLVFFVLLAAITYLYWNSSIGPAKNGGPRLWGSFPPAN